MPVTVKRPEAQKGIAIVSAYGFAAGIGGVQRLSAKAASVMEFVGAIGGIVGALLLGDHPAAFVCEGIACSSGGILGLGLTAPAAETAKRVIGTRGEVGAKGPARLLLKAGGAAKETILTGAGARAMVGAGIEF